MGIKEVGKGLAKIKETNLKAPHLRKEFGNKLKVMNMQQKRRTMRNSSGLLR